ncbi:hypothetical protein [Actinoplanes teichomyceticus]|uniref:Uncharacterized protein n=1 Tax=Actinoplanes teichomyceticus TaxID=1867 RepID=A0A561WPR4_ACTTI|nr:hypothetical protein [Actinoplanes teichomyceticus]TWG25851.1 hypothetical protein FHX34_101823 [Actinoplanes teichomyceticus]GIF10927.1 hypothetical protein Ate01nite_09590 [Actinoplanes teichomyceticus]
MTTVPNPPQEHDQPNEFGFAGDPTGPEPAAHLTEGEGERIAVPSDDLTGAITGAIEDATDNDRD